MLTPCRTPVALRRWLPPVAPRPQATPDVRAAQQQLRAILDELQGAIGYERATVWLYDPTASCVWAGGLQKHFEKRHGLRAAAIGR